MTRAASRLALLAFFALLAFAACQASAPAAPAPVPTPGQVEHIVLIALKDGTAAERDAAKTKLIETSRSFQEQIPGIVSVTVGDALPSLQPVAGEPCDLVLLMRFQSKQALDAYLVHPVHTRAVADVLAPNVRNVVIHDAMLR